jgi:hypothetical protein
MIYNSEAVLKKLNQNIHEQPEQPEHEDPEQEPPLPLPLLPPILTDVNLWQRLELWHWGHTC